MRKINTGYRLFLIPLGMLIMTLQCSSRKQALSSSNKATVLFFDDFSGGKLDRSKWNVYRTGNVVNNELQAYIDSTATLYFARGSESEGAENGALVFKPGYFSQYKTFDGKSFDFISARINSQNRFEFTYGKAEARIKITEGKGFWPAWWLLGGGDWPATGETDIMEYVGEDWVNCALHGPGYSGNTPLYARHKFPNNSTVNKWHVYAVNWTSTSLDFMVDGKSYYRVSKSDVEKYGKWAFDNPKYLILNFALGGNYPAGQNHVTTPYHGLPDSSVQLIKEGKCKMLVDWVKITTPD